MPLRPAFLLLALVATACSRDGDRSPANILFISLDTTRADHLSAYGYERPTSPRLEQLAAQSHVFDAAYTVMPTTLPSHAAMFTSLYPAQLGVMKNGERVPDDVTTLAEILKAEGYATGAFVAAAPLHSKTNVGQGFDTYADPETIAGRRTSTVDAAEVCGAAARWIAGLDAGAPFLAFVHLFDPHTPYDPPAAVRPEFGVPPGRFPPGRGFLEEGVTIDTATAKASIDAYDAEIRYADAKIGELLDGLKTPERTIVVLVSDHGETLDELLDRGYAFDHGEFLYRRELRVPLMLRLPRGFEPRAKRYADVVATIDLLPTLLDLLELPPAPAAEGRSLLPLLRGESLQPRAVVSQRHSIDPGSGPLEGDAFSIVNDRWHWISGDDASLLFDLAVDPLERTDVRAANDALLPKLERLLAQWREHVGRPRTGNAVDDPELNEALEQLGYGAGGERP